jgi:hypothetical protein
VDAVSVPVFDKSQRTDGTFSREDFTYDHQGDVYVCPGGKILTCKGTVLNDNQLLHRASKYDCDVCRLKPRCCPKEPARKVPRGLHEGAHDLATRRRRCPRPERAHAASLNAVQGPSSRTANDRHRDPLFQQNPIRNRTFQEPGAFFLPGRFHWTLGRSTGTNAGDDKSRKAGFGWLLPWW